ncbi:MAG: hypothetical protein HY748_02735 [Elusimicrobia bacterium]|nr:hypothetical protein [Elusimicrobiota bacterium]
MEQYKARYFKRNGMFYGSVIKFGEDAFVSGESLAEVKAKLRAVLPRAVKKDRQNRIRGKRTIEETITIG